MENKSLRALAIFIIIGFVFIVNFAFFGVQGRITEDWTVKFRDKQLASGAVVNERMYYYVLDALDSNKDITLTSILGVEVSRCNDLTKEQLEQVFDYLVEKELE